MLLVSRQGLEATVQGLSTDLGLIERKVDRALSWPRHLCPESESLISSRLGLESGMPFLPPDPDLEA